MRSGHLETDFADGTYVFRLAWGGLIELQEHCQAGPYAIVERLQRNQWYVDDIAQTIRLGLIGGDEKMNPIKANKLVTRYVRERPLAENVKLALTILLVALFGGESLEPIEQKKSAEKTEEIQTPDGKITYQGIIAAGAVMGFTPAQIKDMSVWEFMASFEGYVKANSPADEGLSKKEKDDLFEFVQELES